MESKKINQLATELAPDLSDLTIIGDPTTGISKKITLSQMASLFTGTVEEYATLAAFPLVGVADTIYIALDTNIIYRYDTSLNAYVILSPNIINSLVFSDANGFDGTITLVGSVATLSITTALTLGSVPFIGASGALIQDNSNLFFDDTNNRLGIATASPTTPLDVFGSGIIGRLNATSTNNAYLGFASNGTNKWSAGNVQSDHRFRIFSEANSAELITILQTGEFGIGIANPLTKLHIDGGASALIANLDANVSVAKSISFRSDNSSRINLEVSGTESGSDAGADLFIKTFTDAGASLNASAFFIKRSSGFIGINTNSPNDFLEVRGSARLSGGVSIAPQFSIFSNNQTNNNITLAQGFATTTDNIGYLYNRANADFIFGTNNTERMKITSAGYINIANSTAQLLPITASNFQILASCFYDGSNIIAAAAEGSRIVFSSGSIAFSTFTGATIGNSVSTVERVRLTSGGELLIGRTTIFSFFGDSNGIVQYGSGTIYAAADSNEVLGLSRRTTDGVILLFRKGTTTVGSISTNANSLPSDLNFKKNINNLNLGLNLIKKLRPVSYNHKIDDDNTALSTGFIAQELQQSLIELGIEENKYHILQHTPNKDKTQSQYWLDYTKMIPVLVKAIQEQQAQIEELKAR